MLPENRCFMCLGKLNDATPADSGDPLPKAGDVSICFYCGNLAVFTDDLNLRMPTKDELEMFLNDDLIRRAIALIQTRAGYGPN